MSVEDSESRRFLIDSIASGTEMLRRVSSKVSLFFGSIAFPLSSVCSNYYYYYDSTTTTTLLLLSNTAMHYYLLRGRSIEQLFFPDFIFFSKKKEKQKMFPNFGNLTTGKNMWNA